MTQLLAESVALLDRSATLRVRGRVADLKGLTLSAEGLPLPLGALCRVERTFGGPMPAQVVALDRARTMLMTLGEPIGVRVGDRVASEPALDWAPAGRRLLGRVLDGLGRPLDGKGPLHAEARVPVYRDAPKAMARRPVDRVVSTGIRSIDAMHTVGCGQRLGIFAGTGVGKSVLLGMIARYTSADVTVVALIGERGREVGDFIRKDLGEEGLRRSVLVVSTSDESPVLRVRAGFVATAIAEHFRDLGNDVLLLMDSTTRLAMAQRQIGLAAGEPPATKGYPPSVFALMPRLLERAGNTATGSVTGLYTVLVEGDDINEPISDTLRGILDGHVWLSRDLANRGHFPAVSVLQSISRVMTDVVDERHLAAARTLRRVLAVWTDIEDLVNVGAYAPGTNAEFDVAVKMKPRIDEFLQQAMQERADWSDTGARLLSLSEEVERARQR